MNSVSSAWLVIFLLALFANLPFFTESLFGVRRLKSERKPFFICLLELVVFYFLVLVIGYLLEARLGNTFTQGWQFYAITICLFLVFAFPGFVLRYLRRRRD